MKKKVLYFQECLNENEENENKEKDTYFYELDNEDFPIKFEFFPTLQSAKEWRQKFMMQSIKTIEMLQPGNFILLHPFAEIFETKNSLYFVNSTKNNLNSKKWHRISRIIYSYKDVKNSKQIQNYSLYIPEYDKNSYFHPNQSFYSNLLKENSNVIANSID